MFTFVYMTVAVLLFLKNREKKNGTSIVIYRKVLKNLMERDGLTMVLPKDHMGLQILHRALFDFSYSLTPHVL